MRKILLFLLATSIAIYSCTDEDPSTPDALACFELSPNASIKANNEITFTSCAENATLFAWDFGDGETSLEENPVHIYDEPGTYTIRFGVANETSADTISKTIDVEVYNHFSINGVNYDLENGVLDHNSGKWHSLYLVGDGMSTSLSGTGNLVCLDVLSGKGVNDIVGTYSISSLGFDGTDEEVSAMSPLTIYNGFCSLAFDYSFENESPAPNDLVYSGEENYDNFVMEIKQNSMIYDIAIDVSIDGNIVNIRYTGELL